MAWQGTPQVPARPPMDFGPMQRMLDRHQQEIQAIQMLGEQIKQKEPRSQQYIDGLMFRIMNKDRDALGELLDAAGKAGIK